MLRPVKFNIPCLIGFKNQDLRGCTFAADYKGLLPEG